MLLNYTMNLEAENDLCICISYTCMWYNSRIYTMKHTTTICTSARGGVETFHELLAHGSRNLGSYVIHAYTYVYYSYLLLKIIWKKRKSLLWYFVCRGKSASLHFQCSPDIPISSFAMFHRKWVWWVDSLEFLQRSCGKLQTGSS